MDTIEKVRQSNLIEGITREPTQIELDAHVTFIHLDKIQVEDLERFVSFYQPGARLRSRYGMDVRVGRHIPPKGGPQIVENLKALLQDINVLGPSLDPFTAHCRYESLHPFMDGNGRSGRVLWYWMMQGHPLERLGFLHAWYYQTLQSTRRVP